MTAILVPIVGPFVQHYGTIFDRLGINGFEREMEIGKLIIDANGSIKLVGL